MSHLSEEYQTSGVRSARKLSFKSGRDGAEHIILSPQERYKEQRPPIRTNSRQVAPFRVMNDAATRKRPQALGNRQMFRSLPVLHREPLAEKVLDWPLAQGELEEGELCLDALGDLVTAYYGVEVRRPPSLATQQSNTRHLMEAWRSCKDRTDSTAPSLLRWSHPV